MLTFASECVPPDPAFVVSQGGLAVELDVEASGVRGGHAHQSDMATIVEHMLRPIISEPQFGQFGGLAIWIMDPPSLERALKVRGTLSRALKLGEKILSGRIETCDSLLAYLKTECSLAAFPLFAGTLHAGSLSSAGGFDLGRIEIRQKARSALSLYQNESLIAWDNTLGHPLAMAPDSIAYFLSSGPQRVASNGDLVAADGSILPAFRDAAVTLVGIAADPSLRVIHGSAEQGLILKSFLSQLQAMGYYGGYIPVEKLVRQSMESPR